MDCQKARQLLEAYGDGELAVNEAAALEAHLESCAACHAQLDAQRALSAAVRRHATYHRASDTLRARLRRQLPGDSAPTAQARPRMAKVQLGAALAAGIVLALGANTWWLEHRAGDAVANEVLASHVRSLQASHLSDVASTDQHTVKPWFAGKLDFAPPVRDLKEQGFPLEGGRLDYIGGRNVAALVYRHRQHVINLFVWPASGASAPASQTREGFHLLHWTQDGMNWWAVSDLNAAELAAFADALRAPGAGAS